MTFNYKKQNRAKGKKKIVVRGKRQTRKTERKRERKREREGE